MPRRSRHTRQRNQSSTLSAPAYITRQIPYYELLNEQGLDLIEKHMEKIMAEIGVEIWGDEISIDLFKNAGAKVEGQRIKFEPGMLKELTKTAPRQFTQHARNSARSVEIGGKNTVFAATYGPPFVSDIEKGRRYATLEDFQNFIKLTYQTPYLHHNGGVICEPVDIPVNKRHLDMIYSHLKYSDKPFLGSITAPERAQDSIKMCEIVFGEQFMQDNCVIMGNVNVNSPLVFDSAIAEVVRTYAQAKQGIIIVPFILAGAMGPTTMAGAIAQSFGEALVGVALSQLVSPGAPAILGNFLSSMSLKSGAPTFGMPEPAIAYFAVGQLARRYQLPLRCSGSLTASKIADAQAMQESADSILPAVLCGANYVLHSAGWLEGGLVMGYEKFMLDVDHLGMMHRFMQGLLLDDNQFAMDAFHEVGPGKHFLGCAHTMRNYETAFYQPQLSDSESFEQWQENGSLDAQTRAFNLCQQQLKDYQPPSMDSALEQELLEFIETRKKELPDRWY